VRSPAEIYGLMERGGAVRATGETKMNGIVHDETHTTKKLNRTYA